MWNSTFQIPNSKPLEFESELGIHLHSKFHSIPIPLWLSQTYLQCCSILSSIPIPQWMEWNVESRFDTGCCLGLLFAPGSRNDKKRRRKQEFAIPQNPKFKFLTDWLENQDYPSWQQFLNHRSNSWIFVTKKQVWIAFITYTESKISEECRDPTFDLVARIKLQRMKHAGDILRAGEEFLPRRILLADIDVDRNKC